MDGRRPRQRFRTTPEPLVRRGPLADSSQLVDPGHRTRTAFREDRARDSALRVAGYSVTRLTRAQLDDEPEAVATDLRVLLGIEK